MDLQRADLDDAVARQILDASQASDLWRFLGERHPARARFTGLHVAYYFGALVVIAAMGWLMTLGFQRMGPWAVSAIGASYAVLFVFCGQRLWRTADLKIPGGLLYTMAVCMTPLVIWGVEKGTGFWPDRDPGNYRDFYPFIRSSFIWMEAGTVLAALVALRKIRFPFLVAPAAVSLWFMSMDLSAYLAGHGHWEAPLGQRVSIVFGLAMLFVAYLLDHRTREDFAFWLYLFGMTALWGAITSMDSGSEWRRFLYCLLMNFSSWSIRNTDPPCPTVTPRPPTWGGKNRAATLDMTTSAENPWKFGTLARRAKPGILELFQAIGNVIGVAPRMLKS